MPYDAVIEGGEMAVQVRGPAVLVEDWGRFSPQHSHDCSQLSVTPVPTLIHSSDILGHKAYTWHTDIHTGKTPMHVKFFKTPNETVF